MMNLSKYIFLLMLSQLLIACAQSGERKSDYAVQGLDVSRYQDSIDWVAVQADDFDFTFIKATEGVELEDPMFDYNWREANANGLICGAYHFFHPALDIQEQFDHFAAVASLRVGHLPPVLDIETTGDIAGDSLIARIQRWSDLSEKAYGVKPILYTYQKFYNQHLRKQFPDHVIWIARYNNYFEPNLPGSAWSFWQYTDRGGVAGIQEDVDLNVFSGDLDALKALVLVPRAASDAELLAP